MKIRLFVWLLLMFSTAFAGETEYKGPTEAEFQAINEKEVRKLALDNPELAKMLQEYDEQVVVEKLESPVAVEAQSQTRDFTPSVEIADQAFKDGDHETALKHYEALGEDGDSKASLTVGLIYAIGTNDIEVDKAKAAAWYERSGDQGETDGADLYDKMDRKNELTEEEKIEAKNLIHEFRESDAKLTGDQQTLISDPYLSGTYSTISGTGSQRHLNKSEFVQNSDADANLYALSNDTEANFSPTRSSRGDYSYQPDKALLSHSLPERE